MTRLLRRSLKFLHELGAIGLMGAVAACLVLIAIQPVHSVASWLAVREGIFAISRWILVPSLVLVLLSGLLAIAATHAYHDAGWAWLKALLGIGTFEGILLVAGNARRALELAVGVDAAQRVPVSWLTELRPEWGGLWLMFAIALANVVLAIWRPRLLRL
jgi:hypothetical protein